MVDTESTVYSCCCRWSESAVTVPVADSDVGNLATETE